MHPASPSFSGRTTPFRPRRSRDIDLDLVLNPDIKNEIATRIDPPHTQRFPHWQSAPTARFAGPRSAHHVTLDAAGSSNSVQAVGADPSVRRKSMRNVVRKMFGRKIKQDQVPQQRPTRHVYHKSVSDISYAIGLI